MNMPGKQTLYVRRELSGGRVGVDLVIFDDRVGKYFATSSVGADIWDMLETPISTDAICERLLDSYNVDAMTCRMQVDAFLKRLVEANLAELK